MPTEETLRLLPDIKTLRRKTQALATLDAVMSPDWRYFLFDSAWSSGELMATITNGSGDDLFMLFTSEGAILKGFDHESFMSSYARDPKSLWPGLFGSVPEEFAAFLKEPAFSIDDSTFCIWRRYTDDAWHSDDIEYPDGDENADGSKWLLQEYVEGAQTYVDFCKDYYEKEVSLSAVEKFYKYVPLTEKMVLDLNPELTIRDLDADVKQIGYTTKSYGAL